MQQQLGWEWEGSSLPLNLPQPITNNTLINAAGEGTSQAVLPYNLPLQFQQLPNMGSGYDGTFSHFDPLVSLMDMHEREINQFITQQEQNLRVRLLQQRRKFAEALQSRQQMIEVAMLNQKELELLEATSRLMKLEELVERVGEESSKWQRIAAEQEALAVELSRKIEELNMQDPATAAAAALPTEESIGSCRGSPPPPERHLWEKGKCRSCGHRDSRVVFLPCGHLCSCEICDPLLTSCPFCNSPKNSSIEVLME